MKAAAILTGATVEQAADDGEGDEFRQDLIAELRAVIEEAAGHGITFDFPSLDDQPSEVIHGLLSQVHEALDARAASALVDAV